MYDDYYTFPKPVFHIPPPKVKHPLPQEQSSQTNPSGLIRTAEHRQQSVPSAAERTMRTGSVTRAAESRHRPTCAHRLIHTRCVVDGTAPTLFVVSFLCIVFMPLTLLPAFRD